LINCGIVGYTPLSNSSQAISEQSHINVNPKSARLNDEVGQGGDKESHFSTHMEEPDSSPRSE